MNSISGGRRALAYEVERQRAALARGEALAQETRRWDDDAGRTFAMRTKEMAHDYRYFPEPDLLPVRSEKLLGEVRARVPELPSVKPDRFRDQYGFSAYDAGVLADDLAVARYFEEAARGARQPKLVASWILTDLQSALVKAGLTINDCPIAPGAFNELLNLIERYAGHGSVCGHVRGRPRGSRGRGGKKPSRS